MFYKMRHELFLFFLMVARKSFQKSRKGFHSVFLSPLGQKEVRTQEITSGPGKEIRNTEGAEPEPAGMPDYLYLGSMLPCASISSSHIATMSSMLSSAAVCGSSMAAW